MKAVFASAVSLFILFLTGCASAGVRPGTGDISFRLRWEGTSDLDLHVFDPAGRHVGVMTWEDLWNPDDSLSARRRAEEAQARAGHAPPGILDIDCNADPEKMCPRPIENIFWPEGTALRGEYRTAVRLFQQVYGPGPVAYTLEIRRGRTVVQAFEGVLDPENTRSEWRIVEY
ncbi:MAG: hypothetical protein MI919_02985 [Holophagales bacterium]|nr:hypothetical protein [Holophagales bacterium]